MDAQSSAILFVAAIVLMVFLWVVIDKLNRIIALLERDKRKEL